MGCKHTHGDYVKHKSWVCGKCYSVLHERPRRYSFVPSSIYGKGPRQEIVWQAEIKKSQEGVTLGKFIEWMAKVFIRKAGIEEIEAYDLALECMKLMDEEFGVDYMDWSRSGAHDVVREEMQYWDDECGRGANQ